MDGDAKVLVKCFGGCEQETVIEVLKSLGLWEAKSTRRADYSPTEKRMYLECLRKAELVALDCVNRVDVYLDDSRRASFWLLQTYHRMIRLAEETQDIELWAKAQEVFAKLDELAERRDFLKTASASELVDFFSAFDGEAYGQLS